MTLTITAFQDAPLGLFAAAHAAATGGDEGCAPEPAVRRELGRLAGVPPEEVAAALDAVLVGDAVAAELRALERWGVLAVILPEVQALVGFHESSPTHHKDLWEHTLEVVERIPKDADLRWAALMHDAGKIGTRHVDERGKVAFLRHESLGAYLMRGVAARLGWPAPRTERVAFVIEHHGRINAYERGWSDRAVQRLVRAAGGRLADLLAFSSADFTTRRTSKALRIEENLRHLRARLERLAAEEEAGSALPSGLGHALRAALGIAPGPRLGELIAWLRAEVVAGRLARGLDPAVYVEAARRAPGGGAEG